MAKTSINGLRMTDTAKKKEGFWSLVRSFLVALVIAMLFRTLAYEPFHIPSGSMKPTLLVGDYLFVSKFSYGYSRYSIPFGLPLFEGRIFQRNEPRRGDIVVFKLPRDNSTNYIKRLIGLPGDTVQVKQGVLYLNGEAVKLQPVLDFEDAENSKNIRHMPQYIETLPNGASHYVLDEVKDGPEDNTEVFRVPEGYYFFMGDNRDNSLDSRVSPPIGVGFVPAVNLVGRADFTFFSSRNAFWKVWGRIGTNVDAPTKGQ